MRVDVDQEVDETVERLQVKIKHEFDLKLEAEKDRRSRELESYKASVASAFLSSQGTLEYGRAALRGFLILNGGAAIATLSFASGLIQKGIGSSIAKDIGVVLVMFALGSMLSVAATGLSYVAQGHFTRAVEYQHAARALTDSERGMRWKLIAVNLAVLSGVLFSIGVTWAAFAISKLA
jgi:hypothetical protein